MEKKRKIRRFWKFLGIDCLIFNVGEIVFDLVLANIAIIFLIERWIDLINLHGFNSIIFHLAFAFAIASIPIFISVKYLQRLLGEK